MKHRHSWFTMPEPAGYLNEADVKKHCEIFYPDIDQTLSLRKFTLKQTCNLIPCFGYTDLVHTLDQTSIIARLQDFKITTCFWPIQGVAGGDLHSNLLKNQLFIERNPSYCIDLTVDIPELRSKVSKRRKSKLVPKPNDGIQFVFDDPSLEHFFVENYASTMMRLGAQPRFIFANNILAALCKLESTCLIGVKQHGQLEMVLLYGNCDGHIEYVFSATTEIGKGLATFALWNSVVYFKEMGCKTFHLGGGMSAGDGLEDFKRQFGGIKLFNGGLKFVIDHSAYENLIADRLEKYEEGRFFPAYLEATVLGAAK